MATTPRTLSLTVDPLFSGLYVLQRDFQARLLGMFPADLPDKDKMEYIRSMAYALEDELHEAVGETGWKPWATSNHINREAYRDELSEVLIFLMNLAMVADITPSELLEAVQNKQRKNSKRQDEAYDGVSTKCPECKRAYDDRAVSCYPATEEEPAYCAKTEAML